MRKTIVTLLFITLIPAISFGVDKLALETKFKIKIKEINPTPLPLLFEVITSGNRIFYIDESGRYFFDGNIIDLNKQVNITQSKVDSLYKIDFNTLPLKDAIKVGTGKKKLAVFHDSDCPFCRRLYKEVKKLKNVQVYNFLFNLPIHPKAYEKAKKIYCAKDPWKALDEAMNGNSLSNYKLCNTPIVDRNKQLATKLGIRGTPHMILGNGVPIRGFKPSGFIQKELDKI